MVERSISEAFTMPAINSPSMRWHDRDGQVHHDLTKGNINCLPNPHSRNKCQGKMVEGTTCNSDAKLFLSSNVVDKVQVKQIPTLKGRSIGSPTSNPCTINNHVMSSSRASTCKRKSCMSNLPVSSSFRSSSSHHSGLREGHGVKSTRESSTDSHVSGTIGCVSTSDVVSTSTIVKGMDPEMSLESCLVVERHPRTSSIARDGESTGNSSTFKSTSQVILVGASRSRGANTMAVARQIGHQISTKTQPPFACGMQRVISALEPDTWCSQIVSTIDCSSNADFASKNGDMLMQSTEQLIVSDESQRSGNQLVSSTKNGSTSCGGLNDHTTSFSLGDKFSHNYLITNKGNIITSDLTLVDGIDTFLDLPSSFESDAHYSACHSQCLVNANGDLYSRIAPTSALSMLPPTSTTRSRQNLSITHASMLSSPSYGCQMLFLPSAGSSFSSMMEVIPSRSILFQGSLLPRYVPSMNGCGESEFESNPRGSIRSPFCNLELLDGEGQPQLVGEALAEILLALDQVERDEDLTYEQLLMLEATLLFGEMGLHDQYSDLRLNVDNMSYEELLALEERIGNVNAGLTIDVLNKNLKKHRYPSQVVTISGSQESDIKCSICQEEYKGGDELGEIKCGHSYHIACIKKWLLQKNLCPICKSFVVS